MVLQLELKSEGRNLNFVKVKMDIKNMSIFLFWRKINPKNKKFGLQDHKRVLKFPPFKTIYGFKCCFFCFCSFLKICIKK